MLTSVPRPATAGMNLLPLNRFRLQQSKLSARTWIRVFLLVCSFSLVSGAVWSQEEPPAVVKTWRLTTGGDWNLSNNWDGGVPVDGDDVVISSITGTGAIISNIPSRTLRNISISSNVALEGPNSPTSTIQFNGVLNVSSGVTVTTNSRLILRFGTAAAASIQGTLTFANNFTVNSGNELSMGSSGILNGSVVFTLSAGATLKIGSPSGITLARTSLVGNIQTTAVSGRIFDPAANYIYNGTTAQAMGDGFPNNLTGSLTIDNPTTVTIVALARTISSGALNLVQGTFATNNGGDRLTMGGSLFSAAALIRRSGGLLTGNIVGSNWYSVEYQGASKTTDQELSGAGFQNMTVNLTNVNQTLNLKNNLTIPSRLSLLSGVLNTGSFILNIAAIDNGAILSASANSFVRGNLQRAISTGSGTYDFPVGDARYGLVVLNFGPSTSAGTLTMSSTEGDHPSIDNSDINVYRTINRRWVFTSGGGLATSGYSAQFFWLASDQDANFSSSLAKVGNLVSGSWVYPSVSNKLSNSIQADGLTGFGEFQIGQTCNYTTISASPVGGRICAGTSIPLTVSATGDGIFSYVWKNDATVVSGANEATFNASQPGSYEVTVSGECRSATSEIAVVSLKEATIITAHPVGGAKCSGDELSVSGTGEESLSYQWYLGTTAIPGATNPVYAVTQAGSYKVNVTALCGMVTSNAAAVTMNLPTRIITPPADKAITYGDNASFNVDAEGTSPLRYTWQIQSGSGWSDLSENSLYSTITTPTLNVTTPAVSNSGSKFKVVVTGLCGSVASPEANLTIAKAVLTIKAENNSKVYGDPDPVYTATYIGYKNSESFQSANISGAPVLSSGTSATTAAGNYDINVNVSSMSAPNYIFAGQKGNLEITKAVLTVKADDLQRAYGDGNPPLTASYSGFKNNESFGGSVVSGNPGLTTTASDTSSVGSYPISATAGTLTAANYSFNVLNGTLKVNKALLTVTADAQSRIYGEDNPSFTATLSGFKNGQTRATSGVSGNASFNTAAVKGSPVDNYPIEVTQGSLAATNYSFQFVNGNLAVNKATLTITPVDASRAYGDADPNFTVTYSGFKNGEVIGNSGVNGTAAFTTTATATSSVGTYFINASTGGLQSNNYDFIFGQGTLTITKAPLTVAVANKQKTYGDVNPPFTATYNGFKNGETFDGSVVSGAPSFSTTARDTSRVGVYPIAADAGTLSAENYSFTIVPGNLTIAKAFLTVTAQNKTRVYGDDNPTFTATIQGYKNGQNLGNSGVSGSPGFSTDAGPESAAGGDYTILPALGTLSAFNYDFTYVPAKLTITKAPLMVTAVDTFRVYGDSDPVFRARYTGFKNNEDYSSSDLEGLAAMTTTTSPTTGLGTYGISIASGSLTSGNYELSFTGGSMEIRKATLNVKAVNKARTYGDANPPLTYVMEGFKNNELEGGVITSGAPTLNTLANEDSGAGNYEIAIDKNDLAATNYLFNMVPGTLTVNPALLDITTVDTFRTYGDPNPVFSYTYSGFKNNQDLATSDVNGIPGYISLATDTSRVDVYDVYPSLGSLQSTNYAFNYKPGRLTINKAPLLVKAADTSRAYGVANPVFQAAYIGLKNNENYETSDLEGLPIMSTDAVETDPVGAYTITTIPGDLRSGNYDLTFTNGTLRIGRSVLTVKADDIEKIYGDPVPPLTYTITGLKNGETIAGTIGEAMPVLDVNATASSDSGIYEISIAAGDLSAANYDFQLVKGTLTIKKATLNVTAQNASRVYGDNNPSFIATITGYKLGQTWLTSGVEGEPGFSSGTDLQTPVGEYELYPTLGSLESKNYDFNFIQATLSITPASLTVSALDTFRVYGDANPQYRVTYSGFKNNEDFNSSDLEGLPSLNAAVTATTRAGTYPISAGQGSLSSQNYTFIYQAGVLTIRPALLRVTAVDRTKIYGQANPVFPYTFNGFKNGQDSLTSDLTGAPSLTSTAVNLSNVGQYVIDIAQSNLSSTNYTFEFISGKLIITPATLTVKATDLTKTYGAAVPLLTLTYTGFATGQTLGTSDVTGTPILNTTARDTSLVGTYPISLQPGDMASTNYNLVFADGVMTVAKAPLTVAAEAKSRVYGDPNPPFTWTVSGYVLGQDRVSGGVTGDPVLTTSATITSNAGNYNIVPGIGTLAADNYSFNLVNGSLTVTKAPLQVKADDKSKTYGAVNPANSATYTGFKNTDNSSVLRGSPSYSTTAIQSSGVGTYPIVIGAGNLAASNYEFTFVNGSLVINKAVLTVTADNKTRAYGSNNPALTVTYSGFVLSQNLSSSGIVGSPVLSTTADVLSPVGPYPITNDFSSMTSANYSFNGVNGTLTVSKAVLTVTADTKLKIYGDPNPVLTATITGYKNNEDESNSGVAGLPTLTTTATATSNVGTYPITAAAGNLAASNYSFSFVNGTLAIGRATVTVRADDKSRNYGSANPPFSATYSGFVNGQTLANSGVTGSPSYFTSATASSPVGPYQIAVSNGTLTATNYNFAYESGTLTVNKATITVTAENKSRPYGGANPLFTAVYTGFVNGESFATSGVSGSPETSTAADAQSPVGTYPIAISTGTLGAGNYAFNFVNGALNVVKASLQVRADNQSRTYGQPNPPLTYTFNGFVNGETIDNAGVQGTPNLTTTATLSSGVGNYPITPVIGSLSAANYAFSFVNGSLSVGKATLTVTPDNKSRSYGAANPAFTASYNGFVNNETLTTSGVTGSPAMSTTANAFSGLGEYPITAVNGNLTSANYAFAFATGTLTIVKANLMVTADNKSKAYGAALPDLTATISGYVNGENAVSAGISGAAALTTLAQPFSDMGTYPIRAAVGSLAAPNYNFNFTNGTLTISPASCSASGTLAVVDSCYENPITLRFTASSGTGPFTLIINDSVYRNITSGSVFTTNTISRAAPESIFSADLVGPEAAVPDARSIEVGVRFRANVAGQITGIRFYKLPGNTGTHTASLWATNGTRLATATFANETESGWQQVNFTTPVTLTAGTTYIASYFAPTGNYAYQANAFDMSRITNATGSLTALGSNDGGNGVFLVGGGFPNTLSPVNANYFVDVVFSNTNSTSRFALNGVIASNGCATNGLPIQAPQVRMIPFINLSFTRSVMECLESTNGTITLTAAGCNAPLQYSVDNGATYQPSAVFNNLGSGTYQIRVKDSKNFVRDTTVVLDVEKAVWVGNKTGFWDVPGNWSGGRIPAATTHAIVPPGVVITVRSNATAASVQLTGAGAEIQVNRSVQFTLTGKCKTLPTQ